MVTVFRQMSVLTKNTLLEAFRNKLYYAVLLFALLTLASTGVFGALSLHQEERVFNDLILFVSLLFLAGLSVYQGVRTIHREIETRTVFTVVSKPVSRTQFVVGKYLGSFIALFVALTSIVLLTIAAALIMGYSISPEFFAAYYGVLLQLALVLALTVFFSSFTSPILSALCAGGVFIAGSLTPQLRDALHYFEKHHNPAHFVAQAAIFVLPDFDKLNLSFELTHKIPVPGSYLVTATLYTGTYVAILLLIACVLFARRDIA